MLVCEAVENCQIQVDIILQSSDGILLGSHTKNLSAFNEAFPTVDSVTHWKGDIVTLSETAAVLLLLLQFSHNAALPDISHMGLDALIAFAEAADKYGNNIALQACGSMIKKHTEKLSPQFSLRFLGYRLSRGETDDIDFLVRRSMRLPLHESLSQLRDHPNACIIYALYADKWKQSMSQYQSIIEEGSGDWLALADLADFKDISLRIQKVAARTLFVQLKEEMALSMASFNESVKVAECISPGFQSRCAPNGWVNRMREVVKEYPTWKNMQALIENRS